jgi:hypothetical protein
MPAAVRPGGGGAGAARWPPVPPPPPSTHLAACFVEDAQHGRLGQLALGPVGIVVEPQAVERQLAPRLKLVEWRCRLFGGTRA